MYALAVLALLLSTAALSDGICCGCPSSRTCADGLKCFFSCCATGACNIFCCNCDGHCRTDSLIAQSTVADGAEALLAFQSIDTDANGGIDHSEFVKHFEDQYPFAVIDKEFAAADKNNNRKIEIEEFDKDAAEYNARL